MSLSQIILNYRKEHDLSQRQLAAQCDLSNGYISLLEKDDRQTIPSLTILNKLAKGMGMNIDMLLDACDSDMPVRLRRAKRPAIARDNDDFAVFPVIGDVAAHLDSMAAIDWNEDTVRVPVEDLRGRPASDFFALRVSGDSMYPQYQDGDLVLVLKQATLNRSGDVGVILYNSEEATLKKVEYVMGEDWMRLVAINPNYPPKMIENEELEKCRVLGIPWMLIRYIEE